MNLTHVFVFTALAAFLLDAPAAQTQELRLFEPVEANAQDALFAGQQAEQAQVAMPTSPAFTLVGTSRIGGRQRATLASSTGQIINVELRDGQDAPIDGFPGYRLVSVNSRRAELSLPAGMPCVGARAQGVSCGTDGLVQLSLTTAEPVPAPVIATDGVAAADAPVAVDANGNVAADNPFAAALRAAAQNERAGNDGQRGPFNAERFQPRRIAPEDVPPGMRVVRTPFGDRLVEQ
jgi:hypothetical protein